jgi:hypothetical protein
VVIVAPTKCRFKRRLRLARHPKNGSFARSIKRRPKADAHARNENQVASRVTGAVHHACIGVAI